MKAIVVGADRGDHPLSWEEVPDPVCDPGEVLVDIHAAGVNRADLLQREGHYPPPPGASPYLGLEIAGTVAEIGDGTGKFRPGDRVCALLAGGGYAERVAIPNRLLISIPDDWNFTKAAAVPEVFLTAYLNLFLEAELTGGETLLVHGGASGVGTAAIQLAREAGCRILTTAGGARKLERCRELGAEFGVNHKELDFAEAILAYADGVDVILDIAGGAYLERNLRLLKKKGRLVIISLLAGAKTGIDLWPVLTKRLRIMGSVLRTRSLDEKSAILEGFRIRFWPLLVGGQITPIIDTLLPISEAETAHQILAQNRNIGKVVLTVRS